MCAIIYVYMPSVIVRFPVLISATFVLITGVVFAQVLPEETVMEASEALVESSELAIAESDTSSSTAEVVEVDTNASPTGIVLDSLLESSSSTEQVSETVSNITTDIAVVQDEAAIKNTVFKAADEVSSINDLERPQQCQTEGARELFNSFGDCVRFVTAKISESKREQFEDRLAEQPQVILE
jgi:hypothetical protein